MMSKELEKLKRRYLEAEQQLDAVLASAGPIPHELLQKVDNTLSKAFDELLEADFQNPDDYLDRARFLITLVQRLNFQSGLMDRLSESIERDLDLYRETKSKPDIHLVKTKAQIHTFPEQLVELCYSSLSVVKMGAEELEALQKKAQTHNSDHSITGLLSYDENTQRFFQILEGPENEVRRLMNRIINDGRHTDIEVLFITRISDRVFSDWSMRLLTRNQVKSELETGETVLDWFERSIGVKPKDLSTPGQKLLVDNLEQLYSGGSEN